MLLARNSQAQAVVRVVDVDDDGQVHFAIAARLRLPASPAQPARTACSDRLTVLTS
jgi:hypothetical protein